jgi:adenosylcobinamide kinase/adenosylcobinamide-phosphate guanylyltransferase
LIHVVPEAPAPPFPHLILGGARSGKSRLAEKLIGENPGSYVYVATAQILDEEMRRRVELHRERRGPHWTTIECPIQLVTLLDRLESEHRPVLVDCLTLWISNLLLSEGIASPESHIEALSSIVRRTSYPLVLVSNEVGSGIVPDNALARRFRDLSGFANQSLAEVCPRVTLVVAGLPVNLKGEHP